MNTSLTLARARRPASRALATALCTVLCLSLLLPPQAFAGLFGTFSIKDEKELGKKYNTLIKAHYPIVEDPEIVSYVSDVVDRVAKALPPQPYPITTTVVRNGAINAFATPAGYVYVFTGLITEFEHESELAGVVAHELAHVTQRHVAKRIEQSQIVQMGMLAGMLAGALIGSGGGESTHNVGEALMIGALAGGQSAMLNYSRMDEREADQVGMNYLVEAGFPPQGMQEAFKKIRRKQYLSGSSAPAYLTTHPGVEERIGYLDDRIKRLPEDLKDRKDSDERFKRVQTLVRARFADRDAALSVFRNGTGDPALDAMGEGIVQARARRTAEATAAFDRALELAPNDPLVLREAGKFHYRQGKGSLAERYLTKAALLNPKDLHALFFLARLMEDRGQTEQAIKYYERVLKALPEDPEVHQFLGLTLGRSGKEFLGHLHLAYWGLYDLDRKKAKYHMEKAEALAKTPEEKEQFEALEKAFGERAEFWGGKPGEKPDKDRDKDKDKDEEEDKGKS
ncbi:M48 family metalloprotease [Desulfocurvus sp. DL9XJH121]